MRPEPVVAFRIEKLKNNTTIQNFWIYNNANNATKTMTGPLSMTGKADSVLLEATEFNFYDSQVKYGEEYEYRIYAYIVNAGVRYSYSDHKIAHVIASASVGGTNVYCLKFTDATAGYNGAASDQLYYLPEESSFFKI